MGLQEAPFVFSADYSTAIFGWNIYDLLLANIYHDKQAGAVLGAFFNSGWKDLCGLCEKICETFMKRFVSPPQFVICCFLVIHSLEINTTHFQGFQIFCLARVSEDLKLKCGQENKIGCNITHIIIQFSIPGPKELNVPNVSKKHLAATTTRLWSQLAQKVL